MQRSPEMSGSVPRRQSHSEETVNGLTHALGLGLSLYGVCLLIDAAREQGPRWVVAGCVIYAASLVAVYAASTLSHLVQEPRWRSYFRAVDQAAIYLLIVGNFTPFALVYLSAGRWWLLLLVMWVVALLGFCSKFLWLHRIEAVSTVSYVLLGWLPITALEPIMRQVPRDAIAWIFAGGLCYTAGTIFLKLDEKFRYFHAVWHVLVIAGSTCHFLVILQYVVPANVPGPAVPQLAEQNAPSDVPSARPATGSRADQTTVVPALSTGQHTTGKGDRDGSKSAEHPPSGRSHQPVHRVTAKPSAQPRHR